MITAIRLKSYRSFVDSHVKLSHFNLVLGANGAGKTNFLRAFVDCGPFLSPFLDGRTNAPTNSPTNLPHHFNGGERAAVSFHIPNNTLTCTHYPHGNFPIVRGSITLFRLNPESISGMEPTVQNPFVASDGSGTTQSLENLKNGDDEALFDAAEHALITYVPEIQKLSFANVQQGHKQMQVREEGIRIPVRAN